MNQIKEINIKIIPHDEQRYDTTGDYWIDKGGILQIRVSNFEDNRHALLVALHELVEVFLTENNGVLETDIYNFDIDFEKKRITGNIDEPGDDPKAPYKVEHCIATGIERIICAILKCDWKPYEDACNKDRGSICS